MCSIVSKSGSLPKHAEIKKFSRTSSTDRYNLCSIVLYVHWAYLPPVKSALRHSLNQREKETRMENTSPKKTKTSVGMKIAGAFGLVV